MAKLRIADHIATLIRGLHPHLKSKVKGALHALLCDPYGGKALKDRLSRLRSFRVSRFRIIYRLAKRGHVEVVALGPRERIYEETYRGSFPGVSPAASGSISAMSCPLFG